MRVTVDISPKEGGTVEIDGDTSCSYPETHTVATGADVSLEAVAAPGYHFTEWSGDLTDNENPTEVVKVFYNHQITAHFAPDGKDFTSEDGTLNIAIPEETTALDGEGDPLTNIEFTVNETPPLPQEGNIVGSAYDLEPSGATFDPPVTLTWDYEPADVPSGVAEEDLVIGYYDEDAGSWVVLEEFVVETLDMNITALVTHLTTFAIIAPAAPPPLPTSAGFSSSSLSISPPEVDIGEAVSISVLVTNTGEEAGSFTATLKINGVIEDTEEITLAGGASKTVAFTTSRDKASTYSVDVNGLLGSFTVKEAASTPAPHPSTTTPSDTPSSETNWAIIAPIIGAVFLAIFLPIKLRRRRGPLD